MRPAERDRRKANLRESKTKINCCTCTDWVGYHFECYRLPGPVGPLNICDFYKKEIEG